ncbi:MAG: HD domain-containing protein [Litorilinea sp.]
MMQPHSEDLLLAADDPYLSLEAARRLYAQGDTAHDFDHVLRVARMAVKIAYAEGADVPVVRLAALLHDVPAGAHAPDAASGAEARADSGGSSDADIFAVRAAERLDHHHAAAAFARHWLSVRGLGTAARDNVVHCIEAHRFRDTSIQPATLEAKCLYDADKLDSIGAIGVVRAFAYAGANGARMCTEPWTAMPDATLGPEHMPQGELYTPVHEYVYKLKRILPTLHTETARRIAAGRHAFMAAFFDQLDAEMVGEA